MEITIRPLYIDSDHTTIIKFSFEKNKGLGKCHLNPYVDDPIIDGVGESRTEVVKDAADIPVAVALPSLPRLAAVALVPRRANLFQDVDDLLAIAVLTLYEVVAGADGGV